MEVFVPSAKEIYLFYDKSQFSSSDLKEKIEASFSKVLIQYMRYGFIYIIFICMEYSFYSYAAEIFSCMNSLMLQC